MKKKLSPKQWIGAVLLLLLFILLTLFLYSRTHEDARFEKFAKNFFVSELCHNPITLHYNLTNPSAYGIEEKTISLPIYHANQALASLDEADAVIDALQKFHPEELSSANQYTYILFSTYLAAQASCAAYPYFEEPLSPTSGIQSELPILLADYRFSSVADIESYLAILSQIPSYLNGIVLYEQEKADHGLFMADSSVDKVIEQCMALMDLQQLEAGEHFLEITFAERLGKLIEKGIINNTDAQKWQSENKRLLTTVVAPAYNKLADELTLLKGGKAQVSGLANSPGGKDYYQAYLRLITGSYHTIQEIKSMLSADFQKNYTTLISLLQEHPDLNQHLAGNDYAFPSLTPEEMLAKLQEMTAKDYPTVPLLADQEEAAACTIKELDESLSPYAAPAFYLTPPIDDMSENTIYINTMDTTEGLSLFTTLAHEGYPGHLYQTVYSGHHLQSIGALPLRNILYYGGYIEGWALYVELGSYDYAIRIAKDGHPEAEALYLAQRLNRQIQLCLYSLLDILIHYEGASYEKVYEILSAIGLDDDSIQATYEYIVEGPCTYPKYYLGYLEIESLKSQAETAWGDSFSLYRFHTFLLNNGPADFRTLSRLLAMTTPLPQRLERKN
ncbi:MAG: DUF885 domain-containing protein [Lachnospiraceae bacterium]|nr:DUF885 domain-containing protein [Lachnospiraceae bacterium]